MSLPTTKINCQSKYLTLLLISIVTHTKTQPAWPEIPLKLEVLYANLKPS